MKRLFILALILCTLSASVSAQQRIVKWDASDPNSRNYVRDGRLVTIIDAPEAELYVMLLPAPAKDLEKFLIFYVAVLNKTDHSFTIYPNNISINVLDKKPRTLAILPFEEVARKIANSGAPAFWHRFFRPTRAVTATVYDSNGNYTTAVVRIPDTAAEEAQSQAEAERRAQQSSRVDQTESIALKANTLSKGDITDGVIFFEKKKALSDDGLILSIPLGDATFEMPFGKARTGK